MINLLIKYLKKSMTSHYVASIAQVHAKLSDGKNVIIKILRLDTSSNRKDISALYIIARSLKAFGVRVNKSLTEIVHEYEKTIINESTSKREAANAARCRKTSQNPKCCMFLKFTGTIRTNILVQEGYMEHPLEILYLKKKTTKAPLKMLKYLLKCSGTIFSMLICILVIFLCRLRILTPNMPLLTCIIGTITKDDQYYLAEIFWLFLKVIIIKSLNYI